jgi:hypothetical protein
MRHLWRTRRDPFGLEDELRASRPEAPRDFVQGLAASVRGRRETARSPLRLGLAVGLTALLMAAVASFGGFSYAANAIQGGGGGPEVQKKDGGPSNDQYKRFICHRTGSSRNPWVLIHVSENAVPAHQRHGDIIFPPGTTREEAEAACPPPQP